MPSPSLCGSFLTSKKALIAFTWTITTVLTLAAFILALVMTLHVHGHYKRQERYYEEQYQYNQKYNNYYDEGGEEHHGGESMDREFQAQMMLSQMGSKSIAFVAAYTMSMAFALSLYGSTAIVGFTSLRGDYIAPCFSYPSSSKLKVGIFGGAIIFFANLLLVCAVFFGEVRVEDWQDRHDQDEREPYEVERISTILAVTCMFLSALYAIFAILLFLHYGSSDSKEFDDEDEVVTKPMPSIANDPRRENFITMGD